MKSKNWLEKYKIISSKSYKKHDAEYNTSPNSHDRLETHITHKVFSTNISVYKKIKYITEKKRLKVCKIHDTRNTMKLHFNSYSARMKYIMDILTIQHYTSVHIFTHITNYICSS